MAYQPDVSMFPYFKNEMKAENEKLKEENDELNEDTRNDIQCIQTLNEENDELKEEIINLKKKVYYYDGFLEKMFDEDERGEWSEWTDFVDKISDTDGKELFGFDSDEDDDSDDE